MSSIGYHERENMLLAKTRDMHRAIVLLMEELADVEPYNQRSAAKPITDQPDPVAP